MFENVDGRTTDARVIGILIAHLGAFGSCELKKQNVAFTAEQEWILAKLENVV